MAMTKCENCGNPYASDDYCDNCGSTKPKDAPPTHGMSAPNPPGHGWPYWRYEMRNPDLTYRTTGMFTRFMPETKAGELPWNQIGSNGTVLSIHLDSTLRQLREAGYSVHKAVDVVMSDADLDALAAELLA